MIATVKACAQTGKRRIFNHDILSCTHRDVSGNYLYSGRALGLTCPDDVIQIHPFLKQEWPSIRAHYARIGLAHTDHVIWDVDRARMNDHPELEASMFFFGPNENRHRRDREWQRVVEYINDKNNFVALASNLRVDIPATRCFHGKQWLAGIDHFTYPCYVKAAISVAGKGIFRCADSSELIQSLAYFDEDVPVQIQEDIGDAAFLNLQYEATDARVNRLLATEQILDGFSHQGNRYPAPYEPWDAVEPMAQWLWEKGMRGIFAFDVGVVESAEGACFRAIECNPRFNGASYPSGVARRLQLTSWFAKDIATRIDRLQDIDLSGIEYDPATRRGVIIVNWGTILVGKVGFLLAGSPEQQCLLEGELLRRLA
ncbi:MAG: ATP-grasp domain-containing protein [Gammaproteobacteria bacterium]|nr:ATP-grasp domain-containing protein [Gammaproteobacteria bacterium]